jgi:hypothetical protein
MVSEISVHALLLCAYGEAEHHGGRVWWSRAAHIMVVRKECRGVEGNIQSPRAYPQGPISFD